MPADSQANAARNVPNTIVGGSVGDATLNVLNTRASSGAAMPIDPLLVGREDGTADTESSIVSGNIAFNDLQNPSDALGIL